jgi:hypothetical protein
LIDKESKVGGSSDFWERTKFRRFVVFSWMVVPGIAMFIVALVGPVDWPYALVGLAGFGLMVPFMIDMNVLVIRHQKTRYVGNHSQLWRVLVILLVFTTWGNLIYLFRYVLPDRKNMGRYRRTGHELPAMS